MLKLGCEVTIISAPSENDKGGQKWVFNALSSCVIVEDTGNLTDTCVIELPKKISWQRYPRPRKNKVEPEPMEGVPIKRGDKITVRLGYDGDLKTRFSGYVRNVDTQVPIKIACEDGMFLLKLSPAKQKGFKEIKLKQLIGFLLEGTGVEYKLIDDDIDLGPYRITRPTVAEELNEMKRERGFKAYFRLIPDVADPEKMKSVLYVGYEYPFDAKKKESFVHGKNIINEELEYRRVEDIKMKVKATSVSRNNVRSELEMGDKDGEEIQVFAYNVNRDTLKVFAEKALRKYKYTGHRGSFETFGEPMVNKCDTAHLEPSDGKQGNYLIKKVEVNFGTGGYRQKIELGPTIKTEDKK
ncbi:MAG: hypothetical protein E6Q66_05830 [Pedobacter sp.]|nr:MAG: hypothetical protein E6Q66_05830 [Pedobacter sp.]